jgi:hypothetical protein
MNLKETSPKQLSVFDNINQKWEKEWVGMPEFVQGKKEAHSQIIIRFENETDLQEFAKLIGQKLTKKTKSIWFPFKSHWGGIKKVWVNEK